jgi:hypothetical protein
MVAIAWSIGVPVRAQQAQVSTNLTMELDLPGYEAELDRCLAALRHRDAIPQLRQSLPRIWHVRAPDGAIDVSTTWLTLELEKLEQEPATYGVIANQVKSHLTAMRQAAVELQATSSLPASVNAREHLDKILERREFAGEHGPSKIEQWQARMSQWLTRQILKLLWRLHLGARTGNALSWAIVAIAFFALCYWIIQNLVGRARQPLRADEARPRSNDSREWARDALAASERGDYREAVHCAYWAAVVHLEARGMLKSDRARTPRESLRLLDPHPAEQKLLREFTRLFELIWYGYRPASAVDWSDARTHLEKMGCLTPSTAATANS